MVIFSILLLLLLLFGSGQDIKQAINSALQGALKLFF